MLLLVHEAGWIHSEMMALYLRYAWKVMSLDATVAGSATVCEPSQPMGSSQLS